MINLYSQSEVKEALDDGIIKRLQASYKETQTHSDVKIALAYISIIVAGIVTWRDYKLGFEYSKTATAFGVSIFFIATGLLALWDMCVVKNTVFRGRKGNETISVNTELNTNIATYSITYNKTGPSGVGHGKEVNQEITCLLNPTGFLNSHAIDTLVAKITK